MEGCELQTEHQMHQVLRSWVPVAFAAASIEVVLRECMSELGIRSREQFLSNRDKLTEAIHSALVEERNALLVSIKERVNILL
jgi:hypothetical protein